MLVITFALNYNHDLNDPEGFNYAYVTGIIMVALFMASFGIFNIAHWRSK